MCRNILHRFLLMSSLTALTVWCDITQQFKAPAWPIAVKNPFVNAWFRAGPDSSPMNSNFPKVWNLSDTSATDSNLGFYCGVVVDGKPYRLMGPGPNPVPTTSTQVSVHITPTQTIDVHQAGPMEITLNFLSPVTATDLTRQSLPFVYLSVTASSTDGSPHSLQVYSDISAEWVIGDNGLTANTTGEPVQNDFVILQVLQQTAVPFAVLNDRAQDSSAIISTVNGEDVLYGAGSDVRSRGMNTITPALSNVIESDVTSHAINSPWDMWGFVVNLGNITEVSSPVVSMVGVIRDPSIQFTQLSGNVAFRSSYYRLNFSTPLEIVSFFLNDFNNSMNLAKQLDSQIINDSTDISQSYADLLSLVTRQAMGAIEITISKNVDGSFNSSDIMAFMMDMGVDVLYAAFPMYLYLNPDLGGYLLRPLLVAHDNPLYSQPYAARGLATSFPNASIEDVAHNFGVEETGNMIIMLLAHLQTTGDDSLVKQHYNLIKGWADYLVQFSINPGFQQTSSVDATSLATANRTNLALKGIIGLGAMAKISSFLNMNNDASTYDNTAKSYIDSWQNLSISQNGSRLLTSFSSESSSGLMYNLYADKLLQLDLVYEIQTAYCMSQISLNKFGVPLDSDQQNFTRADWLMFVAAASNDSTLQEELISSIHSYITSTSSDLSVTPLYDPTTGEPSSIGINRLGSQTFYMFVKFVTDEDAGHSRQPVDGCNVLHSCLKLEANTTQASSASNSAASAGTQAAGAMRGDRSSKRKVGGIVAGLIGGMVCLGALIGLFIRRRISRKKKQQIARPTAIPESSPEVMVSKEQSIPPTAFDVFDPQNGLHGDIIMGEIARYLQGRSSLVPVDSDPPPYSECSELEI
ncbi:DUF1793-domain-containing protein [Schizopora paradoxa]|uniref:DUF1793-domain-containing protein n=1 Tax=Schizopora paradoxa TaxID=27342 RepID=A0A0H2R6M9_9AGAM|nr:DUF1793-domain-containing protein [Schizopora paradoxa]